MEIKKHKLFQIFCILCCMLSFGYCCSCSYKTFIDHFCNADFVAQTEFFDFTTNETSYQNIHTVKFLKIYKANKDFESLKSKNLITTSSSTSSCGVHINSTVAKELAIFGYADTKNGELSTGFCNGNKRWNNEMKNKLEKTEKSKLKQICQQNGTEYINDYCLADFVAHVKVTPNDTSLIGEYTVDYVKIYKSNSELDKLKHKNIIFTYANKQNPGREQCTIRIKIDSTTPLDVVLFGKTDPVLATIYSCRPFVFWNDDIKKVLENGVLSNLNCTDFAPFLEDRSAGSISAEWSPHS